MHETYVDAVVREMEIRSDGATGLGISDPGRSADTVYLGGGTPSLLGSNLVARLIEACFKHFSLSRYPEITIEINPASLSLRQMQELARAGVNRVSLGIQSLHDRELMLMGRPHTSSDAVKAFEDLRAAGFDNISVDLIAGFPNQSRASVRTTVSRVLEWDPEHLSVYLLEVKEGTDLAARISEGEFRPDDDLAAEMYEDVSRLVVEGGYDHYEISNFARDGRHSRHNMKYWSDRIYIGFGAGSHGMTGRHRYANLADPRVYEQAVGSGVLPVDTLDELTPFARFKDALIMGLRLVQGIDLGKLGRRYDIDGIAFVRETAGDLVTEGLLRFSSQSVTLTPRGRLLSNVVFSRWV